jgi:hypothetical protein
MSSTDGRVKAAASKPPTFQKSARRTAPSPAQKVVAVALPS